MSYIKSKKIYLKNHPEITESWLQEKIIDEPEILGLGEGLEVKDKERSQPNGRLDLLLKEEDMRFVVELQLGECDPDHIIRIIEYWQVEQDRFPDIEHYAVLVAEDIITSRYWNILNLFNRYGIPLIAIQLDVRETENGFTLNFIKVLDESPDDFEEKEGVEFFDRYYWEKKSNLEMLSLVDRSKDILKKFFPKIDLKYNKSYIGIKRDNRVDNFIKFGLRKKYIYFYFKENTVLDELIKNSEYKKDFQKVRNNRIGLKINSKEDLEKKLPVIEQIFKEAGGFKEGIKQVA